MINVYSKPSCVQCNYTKKFLDNEGIPYKSINVLEDEEALNHIKEQGFLSLPVVEGEGFDSFSGYRPDKLSSIAEDAK